MKSILRLVGVALFSCLVVFSQVQAQPTDLKGYAIDAGLKTIIAFSPTTGQVLNQIRIKGEPETMMLTPDRSKLVVLHKFEFEHSGYNEYQYALEPVKVTIIDAVEMREIATLTLGWGLRDFQKNMSFGLGDFAVTSDSRFLYMSSRGNVHEKPELNHPSELFCVDLQTGGVVGKLDLQRTPNQVFYSPDLSQAIIFYPADTPELRFIRLPGLELAKSLSLDRPCLAPIFSAENKFLYLFPSRLEGNDPVAAGRVLVVSLSSRSIETALDLGHLPRRILVDEARRQTYVAGDTGAAASSVPPKAKLSVIHGSEIVSAMDVASAPLALQFDQENRRLYVLGQNALTAINPDRLFAQFHIPLEMDKNLVPLGFVASAETKRGLVSYYGSEKITVLDLEQLKPLAVVQTGREEIKMLTQVMGAIVSVAGGVMNEIIASRTNNPVLRPYREDLYILEPPKSDLYIRADGRYGYAGNSQTNDITVIDCLTGKVIDRAGISFGPEGFAILPDGVLGCFLGRSLDFYDTKTNKKLGGINLDLGRFNLGEPRSLNDLLCLPQKKLGLAVSRTTMVGFDLSTAKILWENKDVGNPTKLTLGGDQAAIPPAIEFAGPPGAPSLESLLSGMKSDDGQVREKAAEALGAWKEPRAVDALLAALGDSGAFVRERAIYTLGELGDVRAGEKLGPLLDDANFYVRRAAAKTIEKNAWASGNLELDFRCLYILGRWDDIGKMGDRALPFLIAKMGDENPSAIDRVISLVLSVGPSALPPLIGLTKEGSPVIRINSARALGRSKSKEGAQALIGLLTDENPTVKETSAAALLEIGAEALEPLLSLLSSKDQELRRQAVVLIGKLKTGAAVKPLILLLRDEDPGVRNLSLAALRSLTKQSFGLKPEKWEQWWEENKDKIK